MKWIINSFGGILLETECGNLAVNGGGMLSVLCADKIQRPFFIHIGKPDFADVVASGVAIGLKPVLFGRAMPSGDILDTSNKKIASIWDDAKLLGLDGNLAGALVGWRTAIDHNTVVVGDTTGDSYVTSILGEKIGRLASNGAIKGKHQLKISL